MEGNLSKAALGLLDRIVGMYQSGLGYEEIANRIIDTDPQTTLFRLEALVRIGIEYASRYGENKKGKKVESQQKVTSIF